MMPTKAYLDEVLGMPVVRKFVLEKNFLGTLYIITSLRYARHGSGADMTH